MQDRVQFKIISTYEDLSHKKKPITLREYGTSKLIGKKIVGWSPNQGTYGMGTPGFFQLTLSGSQEPKINLVLSLWGSSEWILINGFSITPELHGKFNSDCLYFFDALSIQWDPITRLLRNRYLEDFQVNESSCKLCFSKGGTIEVPADKSLLPLCLNGQPRVLEPDQDLLDAWIITRNRVLYV